eukprot:2400515-Prymnesium_polylepis.3
MAGTARDPSRLRAPVCPHAWRRSAPRPGCAAMTRTTAVGFQSCWIQQPTVCRTSVRQVRRSPTRHQWVRGTIGCAAGTP